MYVDFCAFPDQQMKPLIFDQSFSEPMIVGVTVCPPMASRFHLASIIKVEVIKAIGQFESQPQVVIIRNRKDLDDFTSGIDVSKKIGVIMGLQLPPFDANPENLRELRELGVLFTTIAYKDEENPYGGGYMTDNPLSMAGTQFIHNVAKAGMIIDLSHASHATARDALHTLRVHGSNTKVVASHGGAYSICPNRRNLPDDVLQGITDCGGVVGVYNLTFGLHKEDNTLKPWLDHLNHMIEVCGIEHVVLGTDGVYREVSDEDQKILFEKMRQFDPGGEYGARLPFEPIELNTPYKDHLLYDKLEEDWIENPVVYRDENAIANVMYDNGLHFLHNIL